MADTGNSGGTDWGAALDGAAQASGKPLAANPTAFAQFFGPVADKVAANTGIDSNTILGQWGLETGWGKSVVPGTNNLGNIKSTDGSGVAATDNQTGSNDKYRQFDSTDAFADHYTDLLQNRYKGALGTGTDAHATATALKAGGYAEDPDYVSKLTNAAKQVASARGGTNWDALLGGTQSPPQQPANVANNGLPSPDQFWSKYPGATGSTTDTNPIVAGAAGVGRGLQETALGAQSLVGRGINALGGDSIGNAILDNAQQGNTQGEKDYQAAAGDSLSGKIGRVAGSIIPALAVPAEIGPMAIAGGIQSAGNASLNNQPIAPAFVEGAGMGGAGAALGQGLGAAYQAAKPAFTKAIDGWRGGENASIANIANQLGDNVDQVIGNLRANADSPIAGVQRTAAEAADNPVINRIQRAAQNTPEGQEIFPAVQANNTRARFAAGQDAVGASADNANLAGPGLEQEVQAFTQAQAQRIARGQTELPPVDDTQAAIMQTPAYSRAINQARTDAANAGNPAFVQQSRAINQNLADQVDQLAGTPATLDAARATRRAAADADYAPVAGRVQADTPAFADLEARPGFNQALRRGAGISDNMGGSNAPNVFEQAPPTRSLQLDPTSGHLNMVETPGPRTVDASVLQKARSQLRSMANASAQSGDAAQALGYRDTLAALDNFLGNSDHVGTDISTAFQRANANYTANSVPIDQQTFLQSKLASAVNNLTGEVNANTLNSTINSVTRDQLKPGLRPADRITDQQVAGLQNIGQQADSAATNMTGLSGQGQETLRAALESRATKDETARQAHEAFNQYLASRSPAYQEFINAAGGDYAQNLASRQALAGVLDRLQQAAYTAGGVPNLTYSAAKSALRQAGPLTGTSEEFANNLLQDLQRSTAANASLGAAGSQTSANEALKAGPNGLLGDLVNHKMGNAAIATAIGTGHVGGALFGAVAQKLLGGANVRTAKGAIDLLLNPKKLADALEKYKNQPNVQQTFIAALKQKATQGGKAGIAAVQTYEASH